MGKELHQPKAGQTVFDLDNGWTVSIISDGYGSKQGLKEALVSDEQGEGVAGVIPGGDGLGLYGWLDGRAVGMLLLRASTLAAISDGGSRYVEDDPEGSWDDGNWDDPPVEGSPSDSRF
jgi:hypothetical protein